MANDFEPRAGYFEPLPLLPGCAFCKDKISPRTASPLVDAVYCISLQEEDERTRVAAAHFHAIGLCRHVIFYRPRKGRNVERATWASHRDVARHAIALGQNRVLVLEDDVQFNQAWLQVSSRALRAVKKLPRGWWGFYLGHFALQGYFIAHDIVRVRSTTTHAYIANAPLLDWLDRHIPLDATIPIVSIPMLTLGSSIDHAFANLKEMYALFPMVAVQRLLGTRIDPHFVTAGVRRRWLDISRHRYWLIYRAMRPAEAIAVLLSPLHWMSMRMRCGGAGQSRHIETRISRYARLIRDSALFDEEYYLANAPDVAAADIDVLAHYISSGDREGRMAHPLFDNSYYRHAVGMPAGSVVNAIVHYLQSDPGTHKDPHPLFDGKRYVRLNRAARESSLAPLPHYLNIGGIEGCSPHQCFDGAWYLAEYPDVALLRENPLVHYLKRGWKEGRSPHPAFDTNRYLAEYPDVAAAGVNPLEHYVRYGQDEGRAPWFKRCNES